MSLAATVGRRAPRGLARATLAAIAGTACGLALRATGAHAAPPPRPAPPRMPGPASSSYVRGERERKDHECRACHAAEAGTHDGSLHARSFRDASFQRGYAIEPRAFCRGCHAPESPATDDAWPDAFAQSSGVACVTCHLPDESGPVLAAEREGGGPGPGAPHAIARVSDLGARACASCHEFAFPGAERYGASGLMQKTLREHASSAEEDGGGRRPCADCHMPRDARDRSSHEFSASRDARRLARAVSARAERAGDGAARITLLARDVGHSFPTGDLFRRLLLRVRGPRGTWERTFGRSFRWETTDTGESFRLEAADTRLRPGQEVVIALGRAPVSWALVYQRVTAEGQAPPFAVVVEDEVELARGEL